MTLGKTQQQQQTHHVHYNKPALVTNTMHSAEWTGGTQLRRASALSMGASTVCVCACVHACVYVWLVVCRCVSSVCKRDRRIRPKLAQT
jgi:hypothetical protein